MNVLYVIPYNPANPTFGGALRMYHILAHLCKYHQVTVAGFSTAEEEKLLVKTFPSLAGKTHFVTAPISTSQIRLSLVKSLFSSHSHWYVMSRSEKLQRILDRLTAENDFDIIQSEFPVMAMYNFNTSAKKNS